MKNKLMLLLACGTIAATSIYFAYGAATFGGLNNQPITEGALNLLQDKTATLAGNTTFSGTLAVTGTTAFTGDSTLSGALAVAAATTLDRVTVTNATTLNGTAVLASASVTGALTNGNLTASLPVFSSATKVLTSQTIANTKTLLGIQVGSGTTADDGTVTNTFGTAFASAPKVVVQVTGGATTVLTNAISSVGTTSFILNLGSNAKTFDYIAIGAP